MLYKIEIDWDFRSPSLRVLTGEVRIGRIDFGILDPTKFPSFPVKKEEGMLSYKNCSALFSRCKPLVDVMVRSYFDGMKLKDKSITWFDDCSRKNNTVFITMND